MDSMNREKQAGKSAKSPADAAVAWHVESARSWQNLTGLFEGRRLINRLIPEVCKILAKHSYANRLGSIRLGEWTQSSLPVDTLSRSRDLLSCEGQELFILPARRE